MTDSNRSLPSRPTAGQDDAENEITIDFGFAHHSVPAAKQSIRVSQRNTANKMAGRAKGNTPEIALARRQPPAP